VVAKLDRLSRSMLDFAALMATAQKQSWALVALDYAGDTSTTAGEAMAHVLATFGQFERRLIGQRTREALVAKKASREADVEPAVDGRMVADDAADASVEGVEDRRPSKLAQGREVGDPASGRPVAARGPVAAEGMRVTKAPPGSRAEP
jgi:DNA invertase Pin-like site-specific DNA recombinase